MKTNDIQLVVSSDSMDSATFQMHMNKRHKGSLGGLTELRLTSSYLVQCYRSFHRRLHSIRVDMDHEHEDFKK